MLTITERLAIAGLGALAVGVWGLQAASRLVLRFLPSDDVAEDVELELPCSEPGLRPRSRYRSVCEEPLAWRG